MFKNTKQLLNQLVTTGCVPGISYQILTKTRVETGVMGASQIVPFVEALDTQKTNYYDIASLTKVLATTTRILQLVETGQIALTDTVKLHLPRFSYADVTILDLLTHRSGLAKNIPDFKMESANDVKRYVYQTPQVRKRNTFVEYADANFLLLGYIIETCDKIAYQDSIYAHVLKPLDMTETHFYQIPDPKKAIPTEIDVKRGLIKGIVHDYKAYTAGGNTGHAGIFSTLQDLRKFAECLLFANGTPLFSADMNQALAHNYTETLNRNRGLGYDLRMNKHHYALYHTGFTGPFIVLDLVNQMGLIVLTNRVHPSRDNTRFLEERETIVSQFLQETNEVNIY